MTTVTQSAAAEDIDRLEAPTREEFESLYRDRNRPVILRGVASQWPAMSWTLDYLESVAGASMITVHFREDGDFGKWYLHPDERQDLRMPFAELLDLLARQRDRRYYMTEHSLREISPELVRDVDVSRYVDLAPPWEPLLFVGYDTCMPGHFHGSTEALLCQLHGTKQITLFSPEQYHRLYPRKWWQRSPLFSELDGRSIQARTVDLDAYPRYAEAVPLRFTLHPGEILFIPVHWWHITSVPDFQISMTTFWKAKLSNWTFPVPGLQMVGREVWHQLHRAGRALTGRRLHRSTPYTS